MHLQIQAEPEGGNSSSRDTPAFADRLASSVRKSPRSSDKTTVVTRRMAAATSESHSVVQSTTGVTLRSATESQPVAQSNTVVTRGSSAAPSESHSAVQSTSNSLVHATKAGDKSRNQLITRVNAQTTKGRAVAAMSSSNKGSKSSPVKPAKQSGPPYVYTAIKNIKPLTSVNVFGVVKFVRPPTKGRGLGE